MRSAYWVAISAALLSSQAPAQGRYEEARRTTLEIAVNAKAFASRKVEVLCFAVSADVGSVNCLVVNERDRPAGSLLMWMEGIEPSKGVHLVNECGEGVDSTNTVRPECSFLISGETDEYGSIYIRDFVTIDSIKTQ